VGVSSDVEMALFGVTELDEDDSVARDVGMAETARGRCTGTLIKGRPVGGFLSAIGTYTFLGGTATTFFLPGICCAAGMCRLTAIVRDWRAPTSLIPLSDTVLSMVEEWAPIELWLDKVDEVLVCATLLALLPILNVICE
jgi:hypothetical protein